ncbi:MAG: hypothetical protein CMF74_13755 [Maricaulis sp.]|nr:hypothetical protein [Maricaulis sp.]
MFQKFQYILLEPIDLLLDLFFQSLKDLAVAHQSYRFLLDIRQNVIFGLFLLFPMLQEHSD